MLKVIAVAQFVLAGLVIAGLILGDLRFWFVIDVSVVVVCGACGVLLFKQTRKK